jgi:sugar phosphate permease
MSQAPPAPPPSAYRWLVFILLAAAYFMVYFHRTSPAVVALDMMKDLGAGATLMGLLGSAYFYPYALMQIPAGLLSDSWGPRRTITVFFLLAGVASIAFGLATTTAQAIAARVAVGLGVSMLFVPTLKTLTNWFKTEEFAFMTGLLMAVGGLGVLSAAGPLAYLSGALGWRGSFIAVGAATLILAVAVWVFVRNRPEDKGLPPVVEESAKAGDEERIGLLPGMKMVLTEWRFWPLAVWFFFMPGTFFSFVGLWGGPYMMQVHGLTRGQAGQVLSMAAIAMIVGSPFLSWVSDKVLVSRKKVLVICAMGLTVLTAILAYFPDEIGVGKMYVWCFLLSIFASAAVVVGFSTCKELFPVQIAGTSTGLVNLPPFLGGAVLQVAVGYVLEGYQKVGGAFPAEAYAAGFKIYLVGGIVATTASMLLKETLVKKR